MIAPNIHLIQRTEAGGRGEREEREPVRTSGDQGEDCCSEPGKRP